MSSLDIPSHRQSTKVSDASEALRAEYHKLKPAPNHKDHTAHSDHNVGKNADEHTLHKKVSVNKDSHTHAIPKEIESAIKVGKGIHFSSAAENQREHRQPDFFLTPEGKFEKNSKHTHENDGVINIQIKNTKEEKAALTELVAHETEEQKEAAHQLISAFHEHHGKQATPNWMKDLAQAKTHAPVSDFVPIPENHHRQPSAKAPENGFVPRNVSHNYGGFEGNGGFDGSGMYTGNGGRGDGFLNSGSVTHGDNVNKGDSVQAKAIFEYLVNQCHFSKIAASGILGNMMTESSFQTSCTNTKEGAIGLCQWEGQRRQALEAFASSHGRSVTDWKLQVDFMVSELKGGESSAFSKLQQSGSPAQAAAIFDQYYERSSGDARSQRKNNAENLYARLNTATA